MTTKAKKRYLCIDWESKEVLVYDTKENLVECLDDTANSNGTLNELQSNIDLEITIFSVTSAQKPKEEVLNLEIQREWK